MGDSRHSSGPWQGRGVTTAEACYQIAVAVGDLYFAVIGGQCWTWSLNYENAVYEEGPYRMPTLTAFYIEGEFKESKQDTCKPCSGDESQDCGGRSASAAFYAVSGEIQSIRDCKIPQP